VLHRGAHVLDDDVGFRNELHESRETFGRFQIEPHHALVAVEVLEIEAVAPAGVILGRLFRRFDADDVRAPVRKMAHARRAGPGARQIENGDAFERKARGVGCGGFGWAHEVSLG
jgi:hypothetical protein